VTARRTSKKIPAYLKPGALVRYCEGGDFRNADGDDICDAVVVDVVTDNPDDDEPIAIARNDSGDIDGFWVAVSELKPREGDAAETPATGEPDLDSEERAARDPRPGDQWEHPQARLVTVSRVTGDRVVAYSVSGGDQAAGGQILVPRPDWAAYVASCCYEGMVELTPASVPA
jgi:hypothetical protein